MQVELIRGGKDVAVTNENKLEYIHRVADYRLNVQLRGPASAFRRGFTSVVQPDWVAMFNEEELQVWTGRKGLGTMCSSSPIIPRCAFATAVASN